MQVEDTGVSSLWLPRRGSEKTAQDRTKIAKTARSFFRKRPLVELFSLLKCDKSVQAHPHPAGYVTLEYLASLISQTALSPD